MKYVLGLDLGIASIGWALMLQDDEDNFIRIVNLGTRIFNQLEDETGGLENQDRRIKRGQRRLRRRKHLRLEDSKKLFKRVLNVELGTEFPYHKYSNPYELKIKGLSEKLTNEELAIALYHYMKYRGFKSNRKVEDKRSSENGKLVVYLDKLNETLKTGEVTITQYIYNNFLNKDNREKRIHNTDNEYIFTGTRQMYIDEINKLLDMQISLGVIDDDLKKAYLLIFERQRSFSDGPGVGNDPKNVSPFAARNGISLIEKTIGECIFDKKMRAPKLAFSAESFVLLSFLRNLSIKADIAENYRSLTNDEISKMYEYAKTKKEIKYKDIEKVLKIEINYIKGLEATKNQKNTWRKKYKEEKDITGALPVDLYQDFNEYVRKKILETSIPSLKGYYEQKKLLIEEEKKADGLLKQELIEFINNTDNFDNISNILLTRKTDTEIIEACKKLGYSYELSEIITKMPEIAKTINLSIDLCRKLNTLIIAGNTYDKAMEILGYNHTNNTSDIEKCDELPNIDECMDKLHERLTNTSVKHTLVEMRKLINEVIKKYGTISRINVELARDLANSHSRRKEIEAEQRDNRDENIRVKTVLINKYPNIFKNFNDVKANDILKYRLLKEQNNCCAYSGELIDESEIFNDNKYQIDHILPYSRTFENRSFNKVLVQTSCNHDKGNRTPYEEFKGEKWQKILDFINNPLVRISSRKKETILTKELNEDDWKARNLNDTKYVSKLAVKIIKSFLQPVDGCLTPAGAITDHMKQAYHLTGLTHSYNNENYKKSEMYYFDRSGITFNKNDKKINFLLRNDINEELNVPIVYVKQKSDKELPSGIKNINKAIEYFIEYSDVCLNELLNAGLETNEFQEVVSIIANRLSTNNDENHSILYTNLIILLSVIQTAIKDNISKKDRSNHLHHALDAIMISCVTPKIINNISNFAKKKETLFDKKTGESVKHIKLEEPYDGFRNEVIYRVYERDYNTLIRRLSYLKQYEGFDFKKEDIYPIIPSHSPITNIKGAFTKETLLGEKNGLITKRVSVHKLTPKNIENIIYKDKGNYALCIAVKEWLSLKPENRSPYPILPGKGNYIKKVVLVDTDKMQKRIQVKKETNSYAENVSCARVDVYRKNNEDRIYIVPIYYRQIVEEKNNRNPLYEIMWAQGENGCDYIDSKRLHNEYIKMASLPRYSLIELELKSGRKGLCYSAGASSGLFEIYSILGDDTDLIINGLSSTQRMRYQLTISTIKSIKVRNVSVLGKLS